MTQSHKLPDVLPRGLDIVFVGTAAGTRSAAEGVYYAHPGNRFWRTLKEVGLLPKDFGPADFGKAPAHGIGFTDLCKIRAGSDAQIGHDAFDRARFERAIRKARPGAVAFTSKKAASVWLRVPTGRIETGLRNDLSRDFPPVFVLPSPSGLASGYWDIKPWRELARWIAVRRDR